MPGLKGDDMELRRRVLRDLVAKRSRGGMRSVPRSRSTNRKGRKISDLIPPARR